MGAPIIAVGGKNQLLAVEREHGECVEHFVECDLLQPGAIQVYHVEVELVSPGRCVVSPEDDLFQ